MSYPSLFVPELAIIGVADPGVANEERVILRPMEHVALSEFGLAVGIFDPSTGGARPVFDNTFWFPELTVSPPAWVLVYTGKGSPRQATLPGGEQVVTLFWQRPYTVFSNDTLVPVLFRVGSALVGARL